MINPADLARWKAELDSGDPYRQDTAATELADAFAADDTDWHVTVCDKFWNPIDYADDYLEVSGTIARNQAPQATLKLGQGHRLDSVLSMCENTMVGVILETEGISEAFYVKRHRRKLENGAWTLTSELVGIWDILNYLPIWPSWYLPIQAQPFSHAVYAGPVCTVIEAASAQQSFRIQAGINEFLNNALSLNPDVRAWFGTVLQSIQNSGQISTTMQTPLYVVRTGLLRDTSPLYVKTVRMTTVGQMIQEITPAYGVSVTVELWRPGMPQPDKWANLTQATYVMRVVDRSQIEGPTKTVLDSALRTVVDVEGSLLGKALDPLLNPGNQYVPEGMHIAPTLGIDFVPPYALLITPDDIIADGEVVRDESPLVSCEIVHSTPLGWEHIIGGKSPKALNDLLNAWYSYIIDVAQILLGFTGVPSNLLDGFLNDAFFAFELIQHYSRRNDVGPFHPAMSVFTPTNSSPYNIEALFQFIQVLWNSRGYVTAIATFRGQNGPFKFGRDIFVGMLMILVYASRTKLYTDYVELVNFRSTRSVREVTVQLGDGKPLQSSTVQVRNNVSELIAGFNVLSLAPQS